MSTEEHNESQAPRIAVPIDGWPGVNNVFQAGEVFFTGQPDPDSIRRFRDEEGVRTIINLRHPDELAKIGLDEGGMVEELGLTYVNQPISNAFARADVEAFAKSFEEAKSPVVIHCGSSNRVGGMWAAYLHLHRGMALDEALKHGAAAGLTMPVLIDAVKRVAGSA